MHSSTWFPVQINLGRGISQYLDLNIIPRGSGRVPSTAVHRHLPQEGNELFNSATSLWSAWIQCHTRWKWKIKVSLNRETQFTVIIHVCRILMKKKTPREIKNPINSLSGEQLERPHTTTKYLYWSPPFCIPRRWHCKPETQFRAMESPKGEREEIEMSAQQISRFQFLLKNEDRRKPRISVLTITRVLGLLSRGESLHMLQIYWFITGQGWKLEKPYLVCAGDAATAWLHTSGTGWSPKRPQEMTGKMFKMKQEGGDSTSQWSEMYHIKNTCLMCVHEYTAVPALTWISVHISQINTFSLQIFHPFPL